MGVTAKQEFDYVALVLADFHKIDDLAADDPERFWLREELLGLTIQVRQPRLRRHCQSVLDSYDKRQTGAALCALSA